MSLPRPQTKEFVDRLVSLATECREELARGTQAIQEIDLLLRQTQQEIDRLSQRETQQNNRLREMESSLESFSRSDIRDAYVNAHEVQMRLFMMRSQIEQLESRRESIKGQQEKLRILLDLAEINREQNIEEKAEEKTRTLPGTRSLPNGTDPVIEIINARERERERIARQLSDGPAQVMANLILRTQFLGRVAERAPDQLPAEIQGIGELAGESLMDIRRSIFEMRPLVIDELGLVSTLRRYASDFAREHGATITVEGSERDQAVTGHVRVALFRLIQRAMVVLVAPGAETQLGVSVREEEAQLLIRLEASPVGTKVPRQLAKFVDDEYTAEMLDLLGASLQRESLNNGERVTIVVPLGLATATKAR
jgi:two-component system sensor histidine kinase DegS